ncbi:terminase [Vibrio galatheae]|uniref:Terminase n=1 Tax=Vibrio galatheae TaxID=579748 RepID=A0A0F4NPQ1_9VIBR|nr:terminase small subunit [Vibrio galatheae]KJY84823.1 terminase [Vibrio galatheae]
MAKLTDKQEQFCLEYLIDLNATQAAIRAGYSENGAAQNAAKLIRNDKVQVRLSELKAQRVEETKISAAYVLNRLVEIDQMDVADIINDDGSIKPVSQWPKCWRQTISGLDVSELWEGTGDERQQIGLLKKIKFPDKVKNIELLGKHVDVQAFKERIEQKTELTLQELSDDQLNAKLRALNPS